MTGFQFSRFNRLSKLATLAALMGALAVVSLAACSTTASRKPASEALEIDIPRDIGAGLKKLLGYLEKGKLTQANCAPFLGEIFQGINSIPPEHFDLDRANQQSHEIVKDLFLVRLELRKSLARMLSEGSVDDACVTALRNGMRAARFIDEYVAERITREPGRTAFAGGFPYVQVNPAFSGADGGGLVIRSGDVLLSRGKAFTSAAIARVGEVDGQFSHLALAYVDEKTGKSYVVEAHIEVGVTVATWEEYANDGKMRAVIFRHPDAALAHRAAKLAYERAKRGTGKGKGRHNNIPYDFGMVLANDQEMFCSEVPYYGFYHATQGQFALPLFQTRMAMKNRQFLDAIGVKVDSTYAPSDTEVDPRLELVAEWRNLEFATTVRMKDAVLSKVFEWMDERGYMIKNSNFEILVRDVSYRLRRWPLFEKLLYKQFPLNMSKATLSVIFSLSTGVGNLVDELEKANNERIARTGYGMTFKEMGEFLERLRSEDLERYRAHQEWQRLRDVYGESAPKEPAKPVFHESLSPKQ